MPDNPHAPLLKKLGDLFSSGLATDWQERAYTSDEVNRVVTHLQQIPAQDYPNKLKVAGFTNTPFFHPEDTELEQSCATCMYFKRHEQFCDLPELLLPVLPEWSCILWRI